MWLPWRRNPAPAHQAAPTAPVRPPADQWRLVAPIQRVAGGDILTNPVATFRGSLATSQDIRFYGTLGHGVGVSEPSGTIGDLAQPAAVTPDLPAGSLPEMPVAAPPASAPKVQRFASTVPAVVEAPVVSRVAAQPEEPETDPAVA